VVTTVPTACRLIGRRDENLLKLSPFRDALEVMLLFEGSGRVFRASTEDVRRFLFSRQPWEDYDMLIIPADFSWCIGITHNDDVILAEPLGPTRSVDP
jgi:hypothetical protein